MADPANDPGGPLNFSENAAPTESFRDVVLEPGRLCGSGIADYRLLKILENTLPVFQQSKWRSQQELFSQSKVADEEATGGRTGKGDSGESKDEGNEGDMERESDRKREIERQRVLFEGRHESDRQLYIDSVSGDFELSMFLADAERKRKSHEAALARTQRQWDLAVAEKQKCFKSLDDLHYLFYMMKNPPDMRNMVTGHPPLPPSARQIKLVSAVNQPSPSVELCETVLAIEERRRAIQRTREDLKRVAYEISASAVHAKKMLKLLNFLKSRWQVHKVPYQHQVYTQKDYPFRGEFWVQLLHVPETPASAFSTPYISYWAEVFVIPNVHDLDRTDIGIRLSGDIASFYVSNRKLESELTVEGDTNTLHIPSSNDENDDDENDDDGDGEGDGDGDYGDDNEGETHGKKGGRCVELSVECHEELQDTLIALQRMAFENSCFDLLSREAQVHLAENVPVFEGSGETVDALLQSFAAQKNITAQLLSLRPSNPTYTLPPPYTPTHTHTRAHPHTQAKARARAQARAPVVLFRPLQYANIVDDAGVQVQPTPAPITQSHLITTSVSVNTAIGSGNPEGEGTNRGGNRDASSHASTLSHSHSQSQSQSQHQSQSDSLGWRVENLVLESRPSILSPAWTAIPFSLSFRKADRLAFLAAQKNVSVVLFGTDSIALRFFRVPLVVRTGAGLGVGLGLGSGLGFENGMGSGGMDSRLNFEIAAVVDVTVSISFAAHLRSQTMRKKRGKSGKSGKVEKNARLHQQGSSKVQEDRIIKSLARVQKIMIPKIRQLYLEMLLDNSHVLTCADLDPLSLPVTRSNHRLATFHKLLVWTHAQIVMCLVDNSQ